MKKNEVMIERSGDSFSAYAPEVYNINGAGDTITEVKQSVGNSIALLREYPDPPVFLAEPFEIEWRYDVASIVDYYKNVITRTGLAKRAGINKDLINQYAAGLKKPREGAEAKTRCGAA